MKLLLDTHIALWAISDDKRLSTKAREMIAAADNVVHVSAVSIWEIAIKHSLGRTGANAMAISGAQAIDYFDQAGFASLPISAAHAASVENLPPLHTDPFDRLLVAQALAEPLRLMTHDKHIAAYSDTVIIV